MSPFHFVYFTLYTILLIFASYILVTIVKTRRNLKSDYNTSPKLNYVVVGFTSSDNYV